MAQIISFLEMPKHLLQKNNLKEENLAKENENLSIMLPTYHVSRMSFIFQKNQHFDP